MPNPNEEKLLPEVVPADQIHDFLDEYVYQGKTVTLSKKEILARTALAIFGLAWGLPWRSAARSAAVIFPEGDDRDNMGEIFVLGIVATVGVDGLWIMLEVGKELGKKSRLEKILTTQGRTKCDMTARLAFPGVLSLLSCISSVYATVKYNTGADQYLGIVTFFDKYAYSFFGYRRLYESAQDKLGARGEPEVQALKQLRANMIKSIDLIIREPNNFPADAQALIASLINPQNIQLIAAQELQQASRKKEVFKMGSTLTLMTAGAAISGFLTAEAVQKTILDSLTLAITIVCLSEIPGFVVAFLSSSYAFARLYDNLTCHNKKEARSVLAGEAFPMLSILLLLLIAPITLTAPTAAAYITFTTFDDKKTGAFAQYSATIAISLARIIFSYFTLSKLSEEFLLKCYVSRANNDNTLAQRIRLKETADVLGRTKLAFFAPLANPGNIQNNGMQIEVVRDDNNEEDDQHIHVPQ